MINETNGLNFPTVADADTFSSSCNGDIETKDSTLEDVSNFAASLSSPIGEMSQMFCKLPSHANNTVRSLKIKARKFKIRRFNAQEQFTIIASDEGPRHKCKICGHITKPYVSANTLSQHFSYRHP